MTSTFDIHCITLWPKKNYITWICDRTCKTHSIHLPCKTFWHFDFTFTLDCTDELTLLAPIHTSSIVSVMVANGNKVKSWPGWILWNLMCNVNTNLYSALGGTRSSYQLRFTITAAKANHHSVSHQYEREPPSPRSTPWGAYRSASHFVQYT